VVKVAVAGPVEKLLNGIVTVRSVVAWVPRQ
jgi:hypothetical protein